MPQTTHSSVTDEELEKVRQFRRRESPAHSPRVDEEWLIVAEFGYYFGWEAIEAVLNNEITAEVMGQLLEGARKVWSAKVVDSSLGNFYGAAAAQSGKKAGQVLQQGLNQFVERSKADG